MPALGREDVCRLDVAMDDALAVRRIQCIGNLNRQWQELLGIQRAIGDEVLERLAVEELHDHEGAAVLLAYVVDGADGGVVQCRGGLGFTAEAGERLRVMSNVLGKEFEGDEAMQPSVFCLIHHTHTTAAELANDAVVRDRRVDHCEVGPREI